MSIVIIGGNEREWCVSTRISAKIMAIKQKFFSKGEWRNPQEDWMSGSDGAFYQHRVS